MLQSIKDLPTEISNWLYNVIQPLYVNKQIVYTHVYQFLQVYVRHQFKVRTSVYTSSETGVSQLLLQISGDLNVGNGQIVPLDIWVPFKYPYGEVPIVHVRQRENGAARIKAGNHVDSQGKFYHPFLVTWFQKCVQSDASSITRYNLLELASVLREAFLKEFPLVTVPLRFGTTVNTTSQPPPLPKKPVKHSEGGREFVSPSPTGPPLPSKIPFDQNSNNIPLRYQGPLPLPSLQTESYKSSSNPSTPILVNHSRQQSHQYYEQSSQFQQQQQQKSQQMPQQQYQLQLSQQQYQQKQQLLPQLQHQPQSPLQQQQSNSHVTSGSPFKKSFKFAPNALQQPQPEYPLAAENIQSPPDAIYSEPQDLMDNIEMSYLTANHTLNHMAQLSTEYETAMGNIEDNINKYLQGELKDTMVRKIDQNGMKVNALYDQLTFYHKQAQANSNKLAEHKDYLGSQVEKISQLNAKLVELEKKQEPRKIYVSETSAFDLDKIAMPDLALVSQLYTTVADIRATKDVINAISGTFSSEPEFINDSNLDSCVKAVRGLGRELFWQELTKNHIATIMGLITE